VNVHVLDGNFLLALPSIALQCIGLGREGSQKFHSEISVAVLLGYRVRSLQAAQRACRSEMRRNHLDCQPCLDFVVGADPMNRREYSVDVLLTWRITRGAITAALIRLLSRILTTPASVVPNANANPAPSAGGWLIASGWFGFDSTIKRGAPGRLSRRLRYRSITARCFGVAVGSAPSAEPSGLVRLRGSVF
jgi:hypothetical protein